MTANNKNLFQNAQTAISISIYNYVSGTQITESQMFRMSIYSTKMEVSNLIIIYSFLRNKTVMYVLKKRITLEAYMYRILNKNEFKEN